MTGGYCPTVLNSLQGAWYVKDELPDRAVITMVVKQKERKMMIPIIFWFEIVNKELYRAVCDATLSVGDAAQLKARMQKKRKNSMTALLCGAALFFCGLVLPLLIGLIVGMSAFNKFANDNTTLFLALLIMAFAGFFICVFAANKCFGVAGVYLKALRTSYPNLTYLPRER
jgi:NADH:ubiquinone oxidoreductase subunit 2 (subunit N)